MHNFTGINYLQFLQMHSLQKDQQLREQGEWLSKAGLRGLPLQILPWAQPSSTPFLSHNKTILIFCVKRYVKASIFLMLGKWLLFPIGTKQFLQFQHLYLKVLVLTVLVNPKSNLEMLKHLYLSGSGLACLEKGAIFWFKEGGMARVPVRNKSLLWLR